MQLTLEWSNQMKAPPPPQKKKLHLYFEPVWDKNFWTLIKESLGNLKLGVDIEGK